MIKFRTLNCVLLFIAGAFIAVIFIGPIRLPTAQNPLQNEQIPTRKTNFEIISGTTPETQDAVLPQHVLHEVPFTSQAPFANWDDERFQNACEEAALLMAMGWVRNEPLTPERANEIIAELVEFQKTNYGFFIDSSATDTSKLLTDFFGHDRYRVTEQVSIELIKTELANNRLVIIPADGRKLNNPNYTPPGPECHMLVIIGYDDEKDVFVTNDPGTRNGENFKYPYETLYNAIRDYPSGDHVPITTENKIMIIVSR